MITDVTAQRLVNQINMRSRANKEFDIDIQSVVVTNDENNTQRAFTAILKISAKKITDNHTHNLQENHT